VAEYSPDTYPNFSKSFRDEYLQNWELKVYLVWKSIPTFIYNDTSSECFDCEYRPPQQLDNGDIYIGQWKNDQKFGRGTEISTDGSRVREGYYEDGLWAGKRREINKSGLTNEWGAEGEVTETQYMCSRKYHSCWVKED